MFLTFKKLFSELHAYSHSLAARFAVIYAILGGLWILFSDKLLAKFLTHPEDITNYQSYKGWVFIGVTSILLYGLVRGYLELLAKASQDVVENERMFSTAFHQSPESVSISQVEDGTYIDVNRGFTELLGFGHDEVIGKSSADINIWYDPQQRLSLLEALKQHGQVLGMEVRFRAKDGSIKDALISASVITIKGKQHLLTITKDITDRKRNQEARERFNRELTNKNKELESIIFVASHDLRSSLVNIQGFTKELLMSIEGLKQVLTDPGVPGHIKRFSQKFVDEDIPESVQFITTNTKKIDNLLAGILRISRITREQFNPVELDMNAVINGILQDKNAQINRSGAKVTIKPLPKCYADIFQIRELFLNLVENAVKFLDPSRKGEITISGETQGSQSVYSVEDNGIGIDPKYKDKIFEMFNTLEPTKYGEGLGLTVVRRIVERHNGKVWVESAPGQGSRFYVALPAHKLDSEL